MIIITIMPMLMIRRSDGNDNDDYDNDDNSYNKNDIVKIIIGVIPCQWFYLQFNVRREMMRKTSSKNTIFLRRTSPQNSVLPAGPEEVGRRRGKGERAMRGQSNKLRNRRYLGGVRARVSSPGEARLLWPSTLNVCRVMSESEGE